MREEHRLQNRQSQFVYAQRSKQRVAFHLIDVSRLANDDACLGAAQQFVAAEAHHIHSSTNAICYRWFFGKNAETASNIAAAQILAGWNIVASAQSDELV